MSCLKLYVHLVWSTHERLPLITTDVEERLWGLIAARCKALRARAVQVGGMPDHLHTLAEFPPDLAIRDLVRDLKGGSSHAMSHNILPGRAFRWQDGYGAFTVRQEDVPVVGRYILDQKAHHTQGTASCDGEPKEQAARRPGRSEPPRDEALGANPFAHRP